MLDIEPESRLEKLAANAEAYVRHAFGVNMELCPAHASTLPHFICDRYGLWQGSLMDQPVVLMAMKEWRQGAAGDMIKHRGLVSKHLGVPLVLILLDQAPAVVRQQLIQRRVGFVAPGSQLYVPEAFLDLRKRSGRKVAEEAPDQLSPTAQMIVIGSLLGASVTDANLTELADHFRISIMSVSRALSELEAIGVARASREGRKRRLRLTEHGRPLWQLLEGRLQSPVRKVRLISGDLPIEAAPLAGTSALACYSMLAEPRIKRCAVPSFAWQRFEQDYNLATSSHLDADRIEVETWTYDPRVLQSKGPAVDPLSLYLSLRNDRDERVAQAAEQLLEDFAW